MTTLQTTSSASGVDSPARAGVRNRRPRRPVGKARAAAIQLHRYPTQARRPLLAPEEQHPRGGKVGRDSIGSEKRVALGARTTARLSEGSIVPPLFNADLRPLGPQMLGIFADQLSHKGGGFSSQGSTSRSNALLKSRRQASIRSGAGARPARGGVLRKNSIRPAFVVAEQRPSSCGPQIFHPVGLAMTRAPADRRGTMSAWSTS